MIPNDAYNNHVWLSYNMMLHISLRKVAFTGKESNADAGITVHQSKARFIGKYDFFFHFVRQCLCLWDHCNFMRRWFCEMGMLYKETLSILQRCSKRWQIFRADKHTTVLRHSSFVQMKLYVLSLPCGWDVFHLGWCNILSTTARFLTLPFFLSPLDPHSHCDNKVYMIC